MPTSRSPSSAAADVIAAPIAKADFNSFLDALAAQFYRSTGHAAAPFQRIPNYTLLPCRTAPNAPGGELRSEYARNHRMPSA